MSCGQITGFGEDDAGAAASAHVALRTVCTKAGGSDMTFAERAEKRARAIYEAALFSTLMQQESAAAAELGDEFDFDVTLRETLVRMVSKELQKEASDHRETGSR